jgi:hypothetical protein
MALLKLQDYDQAEQETHLALQLDPHNLKGKTKYYILVAIVVVGS